MKDPMTVLSYSFSVSIQIWEGRQMIALNMAKVTLLFPKYDCKGDGAFALAVGTLLLEAPAVI